MINRVAPLVCLALLCGATACSGDAVTQIVVSVGTDMIIPDELDVLQFQAGYDQVNDAVEIEWELDRNKVGYIELPATIGLLPGPKNGKRPVLLTARAVREQNQVVVRQARLPFAEGRILLLKLNLLRRCIGVTCSEDESCGELGCEKIDKNPDLLPSYSADAAFAGVADQGGDRRDVPIDRRDAGPDSDAKRDFPVEQLDGGDGPRADAGDGPPADTTRDGPPADTTRDGLPADTTRDGPAPDTTRDGPPSQDIMFDAADASVDTTIDTGMPDFGDSSVDSTIDTGMPDFGDSSVDFTIDTGMPDFGDSSVDFSIDTGMPDIGDFSVDITLDGLFALDGPSIGDGGVMSAPPRRGRDNRIANIMLDGPRRALIERIAPWRALPQSRAR
ncbi:MAG: hypothetical protein KC503_13685 [Myxococcales bacterium]|nr:hypothetical protein [Myxococcales bacterium]